MENQPNHSEEHEVKWEKEIFDSYVGLLTSYGDLFENRQVFISKLDETTLVCQTWQTPVHSPDQAKAMVYFYRSSGDETAIDNFELGLDGEVYEREVNMISAKALKTPLNNLGRLRDVNQTLKKFLNHHIQNDPRQSPDMRFDD